MSASAPFGRSFGQVMILLLIAFIFNILLARFQKVTKLRAVFTTGHVQTQQATFAFWIFLTCFPQLQYRRDPEGYFLCVSDYEAYKKHVEELNAKK